MPLFGKKEEPVDWITPVWTAMIAPSQDMQKFLDECIRAEMRRHPHDDWTGYPDDPQQRIISLTTFYVLYNEFLKDRVLERLSSKDRKAFLKLNDEAEHGKRPQVDVMTFVTLHIPDTTRFLMQVERDFKNGAYEQAGYDINPATGKVTKAK